MGGFYERMIGTVKIAMRKTLSQISLSTTQFTTLLTEVEAVINSRPIVYVGEDIDSGIALTPAHFLLVNPKNGVPTLDEDPDSEYLIKLSSEQSLLNKWKIMQTYLHQIWKTWTREYLLSLRERYQLTLPKSKKGSTTPSVGDVVLIKEELPRGSWKLRKIIQLKPSKDNEIRAAKVQLAAKKDLNSSDESSISFRMFIIFRISK